MFPKSNRLTKKRDIENVFRKGARAASGFVFINSLPSRFSEGRATVIVGTKSKLKAVGRNLLKRRARAVATILWEDLCKGHDVIIGFRGSFEKVPKYSEIKQNIDKCASSFASNKSHNRYVR
jgi:ribonuclease P protein component